MLTAADPQIKICCLIPLFFFLFVFLDIIQKGTVLDRLDAGEVLVGDGGMSYALEKRGYVRAGPFTPECTLESPEAGQN